MKKYKTLFYSFLLVLITVNARAQIGINTIKPDSSAALHIHSLNKGLLIPRMTESQRMAISSPVNGLMVYDLTNSLFFYYANSRWNVLNPWIAQPDISGNVFLSDRITGNIGIGTSNPGSKLSVAGNMSIGDSYADKKPCKPVRYKQ